MAIPFNKIYLTGNELRYLQRAIEDGRLSGKGVFTRKCEQFFETRYGFSKIFLTTSCTDALEMAAILTGISSEDEVIIPSYTCVSTANPFILRGARVVFADSSADSPNIDASKIEALITKKTKAIVIVHYAGIACDVGKIMEIVSRYGLILIEDAAHALDSYYQNRPLGSLGHLAAFSFHETKNITSGEGGMLVINDKKYLQRANIVYEKGTDRAAFLNGEIEKYRWRDIGSSFMPSELTSAFLYAQLEKMEEIQNKRKMCWELYYDELKPLEKKGLLKVPGFPSFASNNAHIFSLLCNNPEERSVLISYLKKNNILSAFHFQSLHKSPFFITKHDGRELPWSDFYSDCLLRLPLYAGLKSTAIQEITGLINNFYLT